MIAKTVCLLLAMFLLGDLTAAARNEESRSPPNDGTFLESKKTELSLENISSGDDNDGDIQPRRSYMTVRVVTTSGRMCVECWSGDHDKDRSGCSTGNLIALSWDFNSGASTKFWCSATWGTKSISRFAVFGDGVPKKSSEWRVDEQGKRRTHENGNTVGNQYVGYWS